MIASSLTSLTKNRVPTGDKEMIQIPTTTHKNVDVGIGMNVSSRIDTKDGYQSKASHKGKPPKTKGNDANSKIGFALTPNDGTLMTRNSQMTADASGFSTTDQR